MTTTTLQYLRFKILKINEKNGDLQKLVDAFEDYDILLLKEHKSSYAANFKDLLKYRKLILANHKEVVDYERMKRVFGQYDKIVLGL